MIAAVAFAPLYEIVLGLPAALAVVAGRLNVGYLDIAYMGQVRLRFRPRRVARNAFARQAHVSNLRTITTIDFRACEALAAHHRFADLRALGRVLPLASAESGERFGSRESTVCTTRSQRS